MVDDIKHRHKWKRLHMLDQITELVECEECPARIVRLVDNSGRRKACNMLEVLR